MPSDKPWSFDAGRTTGIAPIALPVLDAVAKPSSVPIITGSDDEERPFAVGSGVLIESGGEEFLVTAAHVAWCTARQLHALEIPCRNRPKVVLTGCLMRSTGPNEDRHADDHLDITVMRLRPELADDLRSGGYSFSSQEQLVPWHEPRFEPSGVPEYFFCAYGFPAARAVADLERQHARVEGQGIVMRQGTERPPQPFDPRLQIALSYPSPGKLSALNLNGELIEPTTPHGLSGCGVWTLPSRKHGRWTPDDVKLVGIAVSWDDTASVVTATKIGLAMAIIQ